MQLDVEESTPASDDLHFPRYELISSRLGFGPVTDIQTSRWTESDGYEPTVHKHRCAQKTVCSTK